MLIQDTVWTQKILFYDVKLAFDGCVSVVGSSQFPSVFFARLFPSFIFVTGGACFLSGVCLRGAAACHPQRSQTCYQPLFS